MTVRPTVTIASLNLHCGLSGGGRPFDVAAVLAKLDADIIAVQEDWWASGRRRRPGGGGGPGRDAQLFRAELSSGRSLAELNIAQRSDRGTWGIAVLTRLPVLSHETLSLGQPEGELVGRAALICSVTAPGGWPLRLVCTHLSPRLNSPAQLVRLTRHLAAEPRPTVIAGDLNMPRAATWMAAGYTPVSAAGCSPPSGPGSSWITCWPARADLHGGRGCCRPWAGPPPLQGRFSPVARLACDLTELARPAHSMGVQLLLLQQQRRCVHASTGGLRRLDGGVSGAGADGGDQGREDLGEVADDGVVGAGDDRRVRVGVDGDQAPGALEAGRCAGWRR